MADLKEQGFCVKFCFKRGKTASETHEMFKPAFGDNVMGRKRTFEWFCLFKHGESSVEDSERSGRPSTGRTDKSVENVHKIFNEDRWNTITEIAGRLGLSYGTYQRILRPSTCGGSLAHTALSVQRFLAAKNSAVAPHPPCSPDLAPCDFFLFPRMNWKLEGRRFQDVTEIQEQSLTVLHAIPKSQFQRLSTQSGNFWIYPRKTLQFYCL
jgi:hypothetical protein